MTHICLVIIYNHRFEKNIDILERIYKERFAAIYHLVPFYEGRKKMLYLFMNLLFNFRDMCLRD